MKKDFTEEASPTRILVLDDNIKSASGVIQKCLQSFVPKNVQFPSLGNLEGNESEGIVLKGFVEPEVTLKFVCNKPSEKNAKEIRKRIEDNAFEGAFDLVLLDDNWPPYDFGGQDILLQPAYSRVTGRVEELPLIALFTQHWDDDRLKRFFRLVHEKRLNWNRLIPCNKDDTIQFLHVLSRTLTTKRIALERVAEKERARALFQRAKVHGISLDELPSVENQFRGILGKSQHMQEVFNLIRKAGTANCAVLIRGETGTGKELVARAIHDESKRSGKAYVSVNITQQPATLIDAHLFGTEAGPGMGPARIDKPGVADEANNGTLFLDEIGDLDSELQAKLLRFIESGEFYRSAGRNKIVVDVRFVSATNKNLEQMIQDKTFREDLFYRVNTLSINLPPLRERREDIPLLANHFLSKYAKENNKIGIRISDGAMSVMKAHEWPDNVRGLRNCIERAVLLCESEIIEATDLKINKINPFSPSDCDPWSFDDFVSRGLIVRKNQQEEIQYWLLHVMMNPPGTEVTDADIRRLWPEVDSSDATTARKAKSAVSSAFSRLRQILQRNECADCGWRLPARAKYIVRSTTRRGNRT